MDNPPERIASMSLTPFLARRQRLLAYIGDGVAIIPTAPEATRSRDTLYPYRSDSYFWYLSAFPEPEAVMVLVGGAAPRAILFCREKNQEREIWDGFRYGPAAAAEHFHFDEAYPFTEFAQRLPELLANREALWFALGQERHWDTQIIAALGELQAQARAGKHAPRQIHDLRAVLDPWRAIKDAHEIALMRRAADITSAAHARAMRNCRPGDFEYALEAEISHEFRRQGATGHAYAPIVAGGGNACVLHYVSNDQRLDEGALVLIDAGCELSGYAADITRTFPVNGRFSPAQRDVYEIVLAAQEAAIAAIRPDASFNASHEAALRVLVQGLVDLRLLAGEVDGLIACEAYKPFYMHRTGHWLGLDVHDVGSYKTQDDSNAWVTLQEGMTLTVEPGLYIRPSPTVPSALHNLGIRIEDDVLLTAAGAEVYTCSPKTVAEIEAAMR